MGCLHISRKNFKLYSLDAMVEESGTLKLLRKLNEVGSNLKRELTSGFSSKNKSLAKKLPGWPI